MRPDGFDDFWKRVDDGLARQPMRPELGRIPRHSSEHFDVSAVSLTSSGPYRIFGYFSVPKGSGPFPALLEVPRYGSVVEVPDWNDRLRYVVLTLVHRGQRLADQVSSADYPGTLADGIDDANAYSYRGVVADCLRGAEFLLKREEVDPERVAIRGNDLALLAAARRPNFKAVVVDDFLLYRASEAQRRTDAYPLEELNDYLRANPGAEMALERTLALFDPLFHAPSVGAAVALGVGEDDEPQDRSWLGPLLAALGGSVEPYPLTYRGAIDTDWFDAWLARQLDTVPMSRFRAAPT